jgi:hypothetical protein
MQFINSVAPEISEMLARYLEDGITLEEFEDWFMPVAWDVDEAFDPIAAEMTGPLRQWLERYANGTATEERLRAEFAQWAAPRE